MPYPDPLASGAIAIGSSLLFTGSQYVTLGTPAALACLSPTAEFTIIVRTARAASGSTGQIVSKANNSGTAVSIQSLGGSSVTGSVGGNTIGSGSGTVKNPTWNCIALVNRNASGVFMSRLVLDAAAGVAEVASGVQTCSTDIMVGARRQATNTDATQLYSGNVGTIAIYNVALTDDQIHYIMGYLDANQQINGLYGPSAGLVAFYPCNELSGVTLHECVQGLNGTVSTTGVFSTGQYPKTAISCVGDSLDNGSGSETATPYGLQLVGGGGGVRNGRSVLVYGFSGQNCAFILAKMQLPAYAPFLNWTTILWPGAHDLGNVSAVTGFITSVAGMLTHNRYLVIGQKPDGVGTNGVGDPTAIGAMDFGTTQRIQLDQQNYAVRAQCAQRWINRQNLILSLANLPTDANDVQQQRMPVPVCADQIHELDIGQVQVSEAVDALCNQYGW